MLLRQIQYFMAVAESHHFTKAAKQLFVSQSALSQQINKLEEDLGVKLLDRISHPITLTPAGEEFYRCAQKIIADINHLELQMQHYARDNQGTLHIGVITGLGKLPLTDIFSKFNTEISPQMQFSLTNCLSKKLCHMLGNHEVDIAIMAVPDELSTAEFELLSLQHEPFMVILPPAHPLANHAQINLKDLQAENFIFPTAENVSYDVFMAACQKAGFTPNIVTYCNTPGQRIDLVHSGLGVSLISESGLTYFNHHAAVVSRTLTEPFYKHIAMVRRREEKHPPLVDKFWEYIRTNYGQDEA
ncbi:putative LysR family transcriptional regulator [Selenomonas ruminantium subsp. lactilytica TAM6421]|uniref:Putative LysR family transcriptional regulator n=1 Tax=Selenomonas ruminantium subsp. lactilytica (strain NBRC 103574 / TAM6421) TaxID=927704 RepID=I0GUR4_SELRL|nr:LysR family transcriptional regulator [Selenomonas ruminantium]BAL84501.1 putative LysR family transcriptional regulator [Selenomonas ruminantium subsp. lactilytica TAM6421]